MQTNKPGRKPKSGERIEFRPSHEVWEILQNKPNKTKFIEESILKNERNSEVLEGLKYAKSFIIRCDDWFGEGPNLELIDNILNKD